MELIKIIMLIFWLVIGFIIWIPMLFRTTLHFSVVLASSAVAKVDLAAAKFGLDKAVGLYAQGFERIMTIFDGKTDLKELNESPENAPILKVIGEMIFVCLFWGITVYMVSGLFGSKNQARISLESIFTVGYAPMVSTEVGAIRKTTDGSTESTKFQVTLREIEQLSEGMLVDVWICNVGKITFNNIAFYFWYEDSNERRIATWMPRPISEKKYRDLKYGECMDIRGYAALLRPGLKLEKPFGKFHVSLSNWNDSFGHIDLEAGKKMRPTLW